jgi:hypothetical protein
MFAARDVANTTPLTFRFYLTGVSAGSHTYKASFARATGTSDTFRVVVGPGTVDSTNWSSPAQMFVEGA